MCELSKKIIDDGTRIHGLGPGLLRELDVEYHNTNGDDCKPSSFVDLIEGAVC